jgi:hypothetical protein
MVRTRFNDSPIYNLPPAPSLHLQLIAVIAIFPTMKRDINASPCAHRPHSPNLTPNAFPLTLAIACFGVGVSSPSHSFSSLFLMLSYLFTQPFQAPAKRIWLGTSLLQHVKGQRQSPRQFFVREAQTCEDPVEKDFFNTGAVAGRTEFEYICSRSAVLTPTNRRWSPMLCQCCAWCRSRW